MTIFIVSIGVSQLFNRCYTDCFIAGTLILTSIGLLKIEGIKVGDEVWVYDEKIGEKALNKVVQLFKNNETQFTDEIVCAPGYPFYVDNLGWIEADKLFENDEFLVYNSTKATLISKEVELLETPETTYNFEVEDYHTYYVGEENILVHNDCNRLTNKEIRAKTKELGYTDVKGKYSKGELIFKNNNAQKGLKYITYDNTGHNGGMWKAADKIKDLGSKSTRSGTFNELLKWIHE